MIKRLCVYCKEMFPLPLHLFLGFIAFFEIYFILLLNYGVTEFNLGIQEIICALTIFTFLFFLRIVDDFKDYETDLILHPERPVPSGRVKKKDLAVLGFLLLFIITLLNLIYMNNIVFYVFVILYGIFMSLWFCYSEKLKKDFIFMMFTHTPYLLFMSIYIISFTCLKYGLEGISHITICSAFTLYFIGFIRGVAREIKVSPKGNVKEKTTETEENKKYCECLKILLVLNIVIDIVLVWNLNIISIGILVVDLIWILVKIKQFIKQPKKVNILNKALVYMVIQKGVMILSGIGYLIFGKI